MGSTLRLHVRSLARLPLALLLGACILAGLTLYWGAGDILRAVEAAGWGVGLIVITRYIQILASGVAWRAVVDAAIAWWVCPILRWVREAINVLLPVAQVGGDIVGARLLSRRGVKASVATASVLADLLMQVGTQLVFSLLGLFLFWSKSDDTGLVLWLAGGVGLLSIGVTGFLAVQRWGGIAWIEERIGGLMMRNGWTMPGGIAGLSGSLRDIHAAPGRLALASAIHMAIWIFGASEVWIACWFMGHPVDFSAALVIESLSHAARAVFFVIPGGLGIQEGAIVALAATYGLSPQTAVAIGLLKRIPDIILGILGLAIWQSIELGWLRAGRA